MTPTELIPSYRNYYGKYHNHKEQMAYVATALYLGAATAVIGQARQIWQWPMPSVLIVALLTLSTVSALAFIWWQLRWRESAADIVWACTAIATDLLAPGPAAPLNVTSANYRDLVFPRFLVDRLHSIGRDRTPLHGPRVSEFITYAVMWAWSIGALVSLCRAA